jgi:hypothetical protein
VISLDIFELAARWLFVGAAVLYLVYCRMQARRRNTRSWESIAAELRSLETARRGIEGSRPLDQAELKAVYRSAGLMMELANCAERNGGAEAGMIDALRIDAMQIRISALKQLTFGLPA